MFEKAGTAGLASAGEEARASCRNGLASITPRAGRTWASIIMQPPSLKLCKGAQLCPSCARQVGVQGVPERRSPLASAS